jgi:large repetitive protein
MTLAFSSPTNVSEPTANRITLFAFDGMQGHRASINVTGVTASTNVYLYDAFANVLQSALISGSSGLLEVSPLRSTATYSVVFDPQTTSATSATLTLYDVPAEAAGSIAYATATPVSTTVPGQNVRLTFTGTQGHRLSVDQVGFNCFTSTTSILDPAGGTVASTCGGTFLDVTAPLSTSGTYTLLIDPKDATTGSTTVTLYDVPADATGVLTINAAAVPVSLQTPGQNGSFTFSGTSGQQATVRVTNNTVAGALLCVAVSLWNGSTQLTSNSSCASSFNLTTQTLPATTTYTVRIDPRENSAGSLDVQVTSP